jgi:DNA mismatch repair ATPase MutS
MKKEKIREDYLNSVINFRLLEKKEERLIFIISLVRLLVFSGGIILIWLGFTESVRWGIFISLLAIVLFLILLKLFSAHSEKKEFLGNLLKINQNEEKALWGDMSAFATGNEYVDSKHDFSYDIDLFGQSSLFQYLNRTVTNYGKDILAGWLADPYGLSHNLHGRQQVIRELASKKNWRHDFMASGMKAPLGKNEISDLVAWLDEGSEISTPFKKILLYILPAASVITLIMLVAGILPYQAFVFIFLLNLFYIAAGLKNINRIHNSLTRKFNFLSSLNALLNTFERESFNSPVLNKIKQEISGEKFSAAVSVRKLGKLIQAFDNRNNILVGFILNGLFLWDYQSVSRLEKWKSDYKSLFPVWLTMIGQVDAYVSFGNYAFNNPDFIFPSVAEGSGAFSAKNLGHQLIDESKRVCNDFSLGKGGTICIVSGANMSGKSTFLRTVAVNFILGMAGAPVCATEMNFVPARLFTSMRTTDSLSESESYFYAELRRLNLLKSKIEGGEQVFFILDEILKGTNSADKSTGSRLFLQRIIERNGTGLLATHDTALGMMENEYPGIIINKCFEIEINGDNIKFDYKIQDGITKKMNAVFLMKQMGILD